MELNGRGALVLGGIKGIGKAVALALADAGASVAVTWFDWEEDLPALERDLARADRTSLVLRGDLRQVEAVPALVDAVVDRFGRLDILVNNIERGGWPVVHGAYVREQWDLEQETTLRAKRWVFAAALPHLKSSGAGAVVNVSSIAGLVGRSGPAAPVFNDGYAAANRAVSLLTESWAREAAPEVRVNEVMLGFVDTRHGPGTRGWGLLSDAERQAIRDHTLLGRTGTLDDAVKAVMFVLRDAPFMTGSVLRLDGGYVLGGERVPPMPKGVEKTGEKGSRGQGVKEKS
jgi:3-oxoacyl-[acyl-carrier protein] reductase